MTNKDALGRLLEYAVWANHTCLRSVATVSVDDFKRDLGSSHGGIRGTLTHAMSAEWIWLERFKGVSPPRMLDEGEFPDVIALRNRWTLIDEHRTSWFRNLREEAVREVIRYRTTEGKAFEAPLWQLIQHVVNHSTYHRGQVATLLRLVGAKPVSTDLVLWDRGQKPRKTRKRSE